MAFKKNTAGQSFNVLAVSSVTGLPVTGDASNITAKVSIDAGTPASLTDTNPTEIDATSLPGLYTFSLTQAETNGDIITIVPSSSTANVQLDPLNIYTIVLNDYKASTTGLATAISLGIVDGKCSSILTDTGTTLPAQITGVETKVDTIDTLVDGIKAKTDQFVFTVANQVDANSLTGGLTQSEVADAVWDEDYASHTTAGTFGKLMDLLRKANRAIDGEVSGTPTTTAFDTNLTGYTTGAFDSEVLVFVSGSLNGEARPILSYNATNGRLTFEEAWTSAPSATDEFIILPYHVHAVSEIVDGVWSKSQSTYTTNGTFGYYLDAQVSEASSGGGFISGNLVGFIPGNSDKYDGKHLTGVIDVGNEITATLEN